jgi:hypothetical protein
MEGFVGRRFLLLAIVVPGLALAGTAAASVSRPASSWAAPEIRAVAAAGLMGAKDVASFRPGDALTAQTLENVAFDLKQRLAPPVEQPLPDPEPVPPPDPTAPVDPTVSVPTVPVPTPPAPVLPAVPKQAPDPTKPVTMAQLDVRLVESLSLGKAANEFTAGARAAGLKVPGRFGTEVVARLLGLRLNHPASEDSLELLPNDPATRAEAAYSVAQVLRFSGWEVESVQSLADTFELPALTDWQQRILATSFARVGMPYIWGGESDGPQTAFGVSSRGATTARASSGASTSSSPMQARATFPRCSAAGRPTR